MARAKRDAGERLLDAVRDITCHDAIDVARIRRLLAEYRREVLAEAAERYRRCESSAAGFPPGREVSIAAIMGGPKRGR